MLQLEQLRRNRRDLVKGGVQGEQPLIVHDLGRDSADLVLVEVDVLESPHAANLDGEGGELIVIDDDLLQSSQRPQRIELPHPILA